MWEVNKVLLCLVLCDILLCLMFEPLGEGCAIVPFINIKTLIMVSIVISGIGHCILVYISSSESASYLSSLWGSSASSL